MDWINFFVLDRVVEISTKNFSFATAIAALKASDQRDLVEIKKNLPTSGTHLSGTRTIC